MQKFQMSFDENLSIFLDFLSPQKTTKIKLLQNKNYF